jgi:hypothetical protein
MELLYRTSGSLQRLWRAMSLAPFDQFSLNTFLCTFRQLLYSGLNFLCDIWNNPTELSNWIESLEIASCFSSFRYVTNIVDATYLLTVISSYKLKLELLNYKCVLWFSVTASVG